jgi:hypothetical protein
MSFRMLPNIASSASAATLLLAVSASAAFGAVPVNTSLDFGYNASTFYFGAGPTICTTVAGCDAATPKVLSPGGIGSEDSWGVGSLDTITEIGTSNVLWNSALGGLGVPAGKFLSFIFHGLADYAVTSVGTSFNAKTVATNSGAYLDVYIVDSEQSFTAGPAGRTGETTYTGLNTAGQTLWLSAEFTSGAIIGDTTTLLNADFNTGTNQGSSSAYLDIIGGTAQAYFDTNAEIDRNGIARDIRLAIQTNSPADVTSFTVNIGGNIYSAVDLPAPAPLLLLGAGLLGIVGLRHRKSRA